MKDIYREWIFSEWKAKGLLWGMKGQNDLYVGNENQKDLYMQNKGEKDLCIGNAC